MILWLRITAEAYGYRDKEFFKLNIYALHLSRLEVVE